MRLIIFLQNFIHYILQNIIHTIYKMYQKKSLVVVVVEYTPISTLGLYTPINTLGLECNRLLLLSNGKMHVNQKTIRIYSNKIKNNSGKNDAEKGSYSSMKLRVSVIGTLIQGDVLDVHACRIHSFILFCFIFFPPFCKTKM